MEAEVTYDVAYNRCRKVLRISNGGLSLLFGGSAYRVKDHALPLVLRIVEAKVIEYGDDRFQTVELLLESPQFDPVPEGEPWPEIVPVMETISPPTTTEGEG